LFVAFIGENGKASVIDIGEYLEKIGYEKSKPIKIGTVVKGKKYILFARGCTDVIIINEINKNKTLVTVSPEQYKENVTDENFKVWDVENAGNGIPGKMFISGNILIISPVSGTEERKVGLNRILKIEKDHGNEVSSIEQLEFESLGDGKGEEIGIPKVPWLYLFRVKDKKGAFERLYALYFHEEGGKEINSIMSLVEKE